MAPATPCLSDIRANSACRHVKPASPAWSKATSSSTFRSLWRVRLPGCGGERELEREQFLYARIRNVYGTVDWSDLRMKFLAGQNWSLATLDGKGISERSELPPPRIDSQYLPGFIWTRQPQLRLVKNPTTGLARPLRRETRKRRSAALRLRDSRAYGQHGQRFQRHHHRRGTAEFNPGHHALAQPCSRRDRQSRVGALLLWRQCPPSNCSASIAISTIASAKTLSDVQNFNKSGGGGGSGA